MLKLIEDNAKQGAVNEYFEDAYKHLYEKINELKKAKSELVTAHKRAENYAERVNALDKAMTTVNPEVRKFYQELVKRLICNIKVYKGLELTIQFHSVIVMAEEIDYYED